MVSIIISYLVKIRSYNTLQRRSWCTINVKTSNEHFDHLWTFASLWTVLVVYIFCNSWSLFTLRDLIVCLNLKTYFKVIIFLLTLQVCTNYSWTEFPLYFCHWSFNGTGALGISCVLTVSVRVEQLVAVTETTWLQSLKRYYLFLRRNILPTSK